MADSVGGISTKDISFFTVRYWANVLHISLPWLFVNSKCKLKSTNFRQLNIRFSLGSKFLTSAAITSSHFLKKGNLRGTGFNRFIDTD